MKVFKDNGSKVQSPRFEWIHKTLYTRLITGNVVLNIERNIDEEICEDIYGTEGPRVYMVRIRYGSKYAPYKFS